MNNTHSALAPFARITENPVTAWGRHFTISGVTCNPYTLATFTHNGETYKVGHLCETGHNPSNGQILYSFYAEVTPN